MRCPTCGKSVSNQQEVCSFCGALVKATPVSFQQAGPARGPTYGEGAAAREFSSPAPDFETIEETIESPSEKVPPVQPIPAPTPRTPQPTPRTAIPSLLRLLVVLAFLLVPLFNFLLRNSPFSRQPTSQPILRQALFCDDVLQGLPLNPKNVFSLGRDSQIMLYSRWSGSRRGHTLSLRWLTPLGSVYRSPAAAMRYEVVNGGFSASGILPLQAGMPLGQWKVEMIMDRQLRAELSFQLRE